MRVALIFLLALLAGSAAASAASERVIRPGSDLNEGSCTLHFVFDGVGTLAGRVFIGTAAHCVDAVGERTSTTGAPDFGRVVYFGDFPSSERNGLPGKQDDMALIEVLPEFHALVDPEVRGHPGMPTALTGGLDVRVDDTILLSGHGTGFALHPTLREGRTGWITHADAERYRAQALVAPGDSGGPILHDSGAAFAYVSRMGTADMLVGQTLEASLAEMAAFGWTVELRTAG